MQRNLFGNLDLGLVKPGRRPGTEARRTVKARPVGTALPGLGEAPCPWCAGEALRTGEACVCNPPGEGAADAVREVPGDLREAADGPRRAPVGDPVPDVSGCGVSAPPWPDDERGAADVASGVGAAPLNEWANQPPGWCVSCMRYCSGTDEQGFCLIGREASDERKDLRSAAGQRSDLAPNPDGPTECDGGNDALRGAGSDVTSHAASVEALLRGVPAESPRTGEGGSGGPLDPKAPPVAWNAFTEGSWRWQVLLDGRPVERCLSADIQAGEVIVAAVTARGIVIWLPKTAEFPERLLTEVRIGRVEIIPRAGLAPDAPTPPGPEALPP